MFSSSGLFCGSSFWNSILTWDTDDPNFTLCFERTVLVAVPCLILWLLSPIELYYIRTSKCRDIPWSLLNGAKLVLNLVLIVLVGMSLFWTIYQVSTDPSTKVYSIEIYTQSFQILTFVLALIFLLWNKVRGIHTSCSLFTFYFLLTLAGTPQLCTMIKAKLDGISEDETYEVFMYMTYFLVVTLLFALNFAADKEPRVTDYPKSKNLCPEVHASFFSRLTFHWLSPLVYKGFHQPLTYETLFDVRHQDTSAQLVKEWEKHFQQTFHKRTNYATGEENGFKKASKTAKDSRSLSKKSVSVMKPIFKTFWKYFLAGGFFKIASDLALFINPHVLSLVITFVSDFSQPVWKGLMYAMIMFVAAETCTVLSHYSLLKTAEAGINIRTVLVSTLYEKGLRISSSTRKESTVGEIVNLMSLDALRFLDFYPNINVLYTGPLVIILSMTFLWLILGPAVLAGIAVITLQFVINISIARQLKALQITQMKLKDERIKKTYEILSGIKVVKLHGWEPSFEMQILSIRNKEIRILKKIAMLNAFNTVFWSCASYFALFASLGTYVMMDDANVLTANIAFVSKALIDVMKGRLIMLPVAIQVLIQTIVSIRRIDRFLNAEELDLDSVTHLENEKEPLIVKNGTFSWESGKTGIPVLRDINFAVKPGSLVAVVGAVGSGKSSLISAFLNELTKISGFINTKGQLAYVPQEAWILNATVRENIFFGGSYDEKKYNKIIAACALKQDFKALPGGDHTEIGEKGINLSGGQKQRVSLARAVYSDSDIYLFDDPLSAVDCHVGKHIFENVIGNNGLLSEKTRVLVTHGIVFLPKVDYIVVMKGGQITETGTFDELLAKRGEFSDFLAQRITEFSQEESEPEIEEILENNPELREKVLKGTSTPRSSVSSTSHIRCTSVRSASVGEDMGKGKSKNKLIVTENTETGKIKWSVFRAYFKSIGFTLMFCTVGFHILYQACSVLGTSWLTVWTEDSLYVNNDGTQNESKRDFYLGIYGAFGVGQLVMNSVSLFALAFGALYAAEETHRKMLTRVLRAPMSFFDTTPSGRIVNRFGKDVNVVDSNLSSCINRTMYWYFLLGGAFIVIVYSTPLFAALIIPVGVFYYALQRFYLASSTQLKRLESVTRSHIFSHFTESLEGAASIRAYNAEQRLTQTLERRVDQNTQCLYTSQAAVRWLGVRLETIGNMLVFFAVLFAVLDRSNLSPGIVGLSISYALQITNVLASAVRTSAELETNIVSLERIQEYSGSSVPQEAAWIVEPRPEPKWPTLGKISFKDYQVRYREGLDLVLRGISFTVEGGQKIGIVGRTGAGKSSLTLCLFRVLEAAGGHICIDKLDIASIGLGDLRSKLTIIPQDPVLFSGSLRMNLDPLEAHDDADIWRVLEVAHINELVRSFSAGLGHTISEGGSNLSVGQRQLVCLARALLRKTKVLILDEATAAIDLETDDLIQETIRKEFRDCTVLTIAHRLNTVMDSDRVLVLDEGKIREFDAPQNLLKDQSTLFYGMAKDAGIVQHNNGL